MSLGIETHTFTSISAITTALTNGNFKFRDIIYLLPSKQNEKITTFECVYNSSGILELDILKDTTFNSDIANTIKFTDNDIISNVTPIRKAHLVETRLLLNKAFEVLGHRFGDAFYGTHDYGSARIRWKDIPSYQIEAPTNMACGLSTIDGEFKDTIVLKDIEFSLDGGNTWEYQEASPQAIGFETIDQTRYVKLHLGRTSANTGGYIIKIKQDGYRDEINQSDIEYKPTNINKIIEPKEYHYYVYITPFFCSWLKPSDDCISNINFDTTPPENLYRKDMLDFITNGDDFPYKPYFGFYVTFSLNMIEDSYGGGVVEPYLNPDKCMTLKWTDEEQTPYEQNFNLMNSAIATVGDFVEIDLSYMIKIWDIHHDPRFRNGDLIEGHNPIIKSQFQNTKIRFTLDDFISSNSTLITSDEGDYVYREDTFDRNLFGSTEKRVTKCKWYNLDDDEIIANSESNRYQFGARYCSEITSAQSSWELSLKKLSSYFKFPESLVGDLNIHTQVDYYWHPHKMKITYTPDVPKILEIYGVKNMNPYLAIIRSGVEISTPWPIVNDMDTMGMEGDGSSLIIGSNWDQYISNYPFSDINVSSIRNETEITLTKIEVFGCCPKDMAAANSLAYFNAIEGNSFEDNADFYNSTIREHAISICIYDPPLTIPLIPRSIGEVPIAGEEVIGGQPERHPTTFSGQDIRRKGQLFYLGMQKPYMISDLYSRRIALLATLISVQYNDSTGMFDAEIEFDMPYSFLDADNIQCPIYGNIFKCIVPIGFKTDGRAMSYANFYDFFSIRNYNGIPYEHEHLVFNINTIGISSENPAIDDSFKDMNFPHCFNRHAGMPPSMSYFGYEGNFIQCFPIYSEYNNFLNHYEGSWYTNFPDESNYHTHIDYEQESELYSNGINFLRYASNMFSFLNISIGHGTRLDTKAPSQTAYQTQTKEQNTYWEYSSGISGEDVFQARSTSTTEQIYAGYYDMLNAAFFYVIVNGEKKEQPYAETLIRYEQQGTDFERKIKVVTSISDHALFFDRYVEEFVPWSYIIYPETSWEAGDVDSPEGPCIVFFNTRTAAESLYANVYQSTLLTGIVYDTNMSLSVPVYATVHQNGSLSDIFVSGYGTKLSEYIPPAIVNPLSGIQNSNPFYGINIQLFGIPIYPISFYSTDSYICPLQAPPYTREPISLYFENGIGNTGEGIAELYSDIRGLNLDIMLSDTKGFSINSVDYVENIPIHNGPITRWRDGNVSICANEYLYGALNICSAQEFNGNIVISDWNHDTAPDIHDFFNENKATESNISILTKDQLVITDTSEIVSLSSPETTSDDKVAILSKDLLHVNSIDVYNSLHDHMIPKLNSDLLDGHHWDEIAFLIESALPRTVASVLSGGISGNSVSYTVPQGQVHALYATATAGFFPGMAFMGVHQHIWQLTLSGPSASNQAVFVKGTGSNYNFDCHGVTLTTSIITPNLTAGTYYFYSNLVQVMGCPGAVIGPHSIFVTKLKS